MEKKKTERWKLSTWEPWKKYVENFKKNPLDGWMRISSYVIGPIITLISWFGDYLKWGVLTAIVITLAILVWRHQRTTENLESPKKHNRIGIIVLIFFSLIILALFIPFTGNKIEHLYFQTITPTITATILTPTNTPEPSVTITPPPTNTPLPTYTLLPTSTPTNTPTHTPTVTPTFPSEEFTNYCIPDSWLLIPQTIMSIHSLKEEECKNNYRRFGFISQDKGLTVNIRSITYTQLIGLVRNLPSGDWTLEITLTVKIYHLEGGNEKDNFNNYFTISLVDSNNSDISIFQKLVSFIDTYNPAYTNLRVFGTYETYFESINPLFINCSKKDLNVSCSVTGTSSKESSNDTITRTTTLTNDSSGTELFLGYNLRPESVIDIKITSFNITPR